jgi:hypothetical protein
MARVAVLRLLAEELLSWLGYCFLEPEQVMLGMLSFYTVSVGVQGRLGEIWGFESMSDADES